MDTAAIYLNENELYNIRKLAEQKTISDELKYNLNFHTCAAYPVLYNEKELSELLELIPKTEGYKDTRHYLQTAGVNIFGWNYENVL